MQKWKQLPLLMKSYVVNYFLNLWIDELYVKNPGMLSVFTRFVTGKKWASINEISPKRLQCKLADVLSSKVVTDHKTTERDRGIGHWKHKRHYPSVFTNATFFRIYTVHCYI